MKKKFLLLRETLLKDLLGERVEEYENFSKDRKSQYKRKHRQLIPLWKFILHLLHRDVDSRYVVWSKYNSLQFQIKDPTSVADLWGSIKYKSDMTYEKLARAMRYYYRKNIIEKVNRKRYSYRFVLSNKTKKYITKLMDINGSTISQIPTMHDSPTIPENSTDDDTASMSSLTSYESNSSSGCSIPDQGPQSPIPKDENEVKYQEPLLEFSSVPLQELNSSLSLAVPTVKNVLPSVCVQQNKAEKHVNKIRKSNIRLQSTDPEHTSAFSPPNKTTCVEAKNEAVKEMIFREAGRNTTAKVEKVGVPYSEFRRHVPFNHERITPATIYALKLEPNILTDLGMGMDDNIAKEQLKSTETFQKAPETISKVDADSNEIETLLESRVERTELNAKSDMVPFTTPNVITNTSKLHHKDPFMGCVDWRNENLHECFYSCDVFDDLC